MTNFQIINIITSLLTGLFIFTVSPQSISIDSLEISVDQYEVTIDQYRDFLFISDHTSTYDRHQTGYHFSFESKSWTEYELEGTWIENIQNLDGSLPVTMVSYQDACAYCESKQGRLPTSTEWDTYSGTEVIKGNIWHGIFPYKDYGNDGYKNSLSPVGEMTPLSNGLHDIYGNAWEYIKSEPNTVIAKGGSYLCDFSMCSETKGKGHMQINNEQLIQPNIGFRCVYDLDNN